MPVVVRATVLQVDAAAARQNFLERDFAYQRLVRSCENLLLHDARCRHRKLTLALLPYHAASVLTLLLVHLTTLQCCCCVSQDAHIDALCKSQSSSPSKASLLNRLVRSASSSLGRDSSASLDLVLALPQGSAGSSGSSTAAAAATTSKHHLWSGAELL
eukprot:17810-Heterococcus_DN1.PRE.3